MEYRPLGKTGLKVSVAGLGCGGFSRSATAASPPPSAERIAAAASKARLTWSS